MVSRVAWTFPVLAQRAASEVPSLDARSWDHPSHPLVKVVSGHSLGLNGLFEHPNGG